MPDEQEQPKQDPSFQDDRPIKIPKEDRFGRYPFAQKLARDLVNWRGQESLVVGLNGKWGSGKSSVKNLIFYALKEANDPLTCVEFNPWLVSGEEAITKAFFNEITLKLEACDDDDGKAVRLEKWRKYSRYLGLSSKLASGIEVAGLFVPGLAAIGGAANKALGKAGELADIAAGTLEDKEVSLTQLKSELTAEFKKLPKPLLVVIDDMDRLTKSEIRLVIQLVKSNADFPNITYLLLYQRETVAKSLQDIVGEDGHHYLQKIVQVDLEIPPPRPLQLRKYLADAIDPLSKYAILRGEDEDRWRNVATAALWPLYQTPRQIVRLKCMLGFYLESHTEAGHLNVNFVDLILLETLRIHFPSVYDDLARGFSKNDESIYTFYYSSEAAVKRLKAGVQRHCDRETEEHLKEPLKALLLELLPQANEYFDHDRAAELKWLREMRLCHSSHFPKYFHLTIQEGEITAEYISQLIRDDVTPQEVHELLEGQLETHEAFEAVMEYLRALSNEIPEHIIPHLIGQLFELSEQLPEDVEFSFVSAGALHTLCDLVSVLLSRTQTLVDRDQIYLSHLQDATVLLGPAFYLVRFVTTKEAAADPERTAPDPIQRILSDSAILQGREELAAKLMTKARSGELLASSEASKFLYYLWNWGDQNEIKEWVSGLGKSLSDLLPLLKASMSISHTQAGREGWTNYTFIPADMERFFSKSFFKELTPLKTDDTIGELLIEALIKWANGNLKTRDGRIFVAKKDDKGGAVSGTPDPY
jgi:hypothetical protein